MTGSVKQAFVALALAKKGATAPKQHGDGRAFSDALRTPAKAPAASARRAESAAPQRTASVEKPVQTAVASQTAANPPAAAAPAAAIAASVGTAGEPAAMPHSAIIDRLRQAFPQGAPEVGRTDIAASPAEPHAAERQMPAQPSGQYRSDPISVVLSDLNERLRSLTGRPLSPPPERATDANPVIPQENVVSAKPDGIVSAGTAASRPAMRVAVDRPANPEDRAPAGAEHASSVESESASRVESESALSIASNPARPKPPGTDDLPPRRADRTALPEAVHLQEQPSSGPSDGVAEPVAPPAVVEHPPRRSIDIAAVTRPASPREALRALLTQLERKPAETEPAQPPEEAEAKAEQPPPESGHREAPARPVPGAAPGMQRQRNPETHAARSPSTATALPSGNITAGRRPDTAAPHAAPQTDTPTDTPADTRSLWGADVFDIAGIAPDLLRAALALEQPETAANGTAATAGETPHAAPAATPLRHGAETAKPALRPAASAVMPQTDGPTASVEPTDPDPTAMEHAERRDENAPAVFAASERREPPPALQERLRVADQPAPPSFAAQAPAAPAQPAAPVAARNDGRAPVAGRASAAVVPDRADARETRHAEAARPAMTGRTPPHAETPARPAAPALQPATRDVGPMRAQNEVRTSSAPAIDRTRQPARSDNATLPASPEAPPMDDGALQAAAPETARAEIARAPAPAATIRQPADMPAAIAEPAPERAAAPADRSAQSDDFEPLAASARPAATEARFVGGVSVEAAQSIPAPAAAGGPVPIADLATVLSAEPAWKSMAGTHAGFQTLGGHVRHASTLRIELKPVELGAVTAELKLVGDQLSVAISVDTQEAYQRLSQDHDSIVQSLRGLGLQVDQVSIQQPQIAARSDQGGTSFNAGPRDPDSSASGQPGSGQGQQGARNQSGGSRDESYNPASQARRGADAGGIYI